MSSLIVELKPFEEAARQMQGWQFEYLPETLGEEVPWSYEGLAAELAKLSGSVIDLGTGGGEAFSRILDAANCDAYATEAWAPNASVARNQLANLARVIRCSASQLPFSDNAFDLVLARHEAITPFEIVRVLRPGGCFLSQQVINDFMCELGDYFSERVIFPDFFNDYQESFAQVGMQMTRAEEYRYEIRFRELGHLVYQLVAAPWTVPGFTVDTHIDGLMALNEKLMAGEPLVFSAGYYLLEARREVEQAV